MNASRIASECPLCARPLKRQTRRSDGQAFLACTGFPRCKFAEDIDLSIERIARAVTVVENDNHCFRAWLEQIHTHLLTHCDCEECVSTARELEMHLSPPAQKRSAR